MFWEGYVIFLTSYANSDCDFILFILFWINLQSELNNISNASYDSHGGRNEVNSSITTPVIQSQDKNLCLSLDSEMDTTPEGSAH
jgi:hypothetical protein